jgi:hypothetical protein
MDIQITLPRQGYEVLRRWPRYKIDVPVRLIALRPTKLVIVSGRGTQLGCGGNDAKSHVSEEELVLNHWKSKTQSAVTAS